MAKITLTEALRDYLKSTALQAFTAAELARAVEPALGREPAITTVSRIMGAEPGWEKFTTDGRVAFRRS